MSTCEKCGGSGWRILERDGVSGAEPCECQPREIPADLEAAANIPPRYRSVSIDPTRETFRALNDEHRKILNDLRCYVRDFVDLHRPGKKSGLMFIGGTGTGKTHLAVAVLRELMKNGIACLFYDYTNLLERIRAGYDQLSNAADRETYQSCLEAPVLLIDDLGSHRVRDWIEDTITGIVTYRCNHNKPLIVTTNVADPDAGFNMMQRSASGNVEYQRDLADKIGIRARSRLFEMCKVIRMPETGDYRLRRNV